MLSIVVFLGNYPYLLKLTLFLLGTNDCLLTMVPMYCTMVP